MRKSAAPQGRGPAAGRVRRTAEPTRTGKIGSITDEETQRMLDEREQQELIEEE
jgi:hypothetical protein